MDGWTDGQTDGNCSFIPFQQSLIIMSRWKGDNEKLLNGAKVTKKGLHLYLEPKCQIQYNFNGSNTLTPENMFETGVVRANEC